MQSDPNAFGNGMSQSYNFVNGISNSIQQSFERGEKRAELRGQKNALSAYAANPKDPAASAGLMQSNPELFMQLQQRQQEEARKTLTDNREGIVRAGKLLRRLNVKDEASFQQARQMAQQMGMNLANVPTNFDQQWVKNIVNIADAFEKEQPSSALIQGYEYRQGLSEADRPGFDKYQQNARPQILGNPQYGYSVYDPNAGQGGGQDIPTVATPQDAMKLPPGSQFKLPDGRIGTVPGGAGGNTSGGFPSGNPLDPNLGQ